MITIEKTKTTEIDVKIIPPGLAVPVEVVLNISDSDAEEDIEPISHEKIIKTIHL